MKKIDFRQRAAKTEERKRKSKYADVMVRATVMGLMKPDEDVDRMMDIESADKKFNMRLDEWLNADDFNFAHDFYGIVNNINREKGFPEEAMNGDIDLQTKCNVGLIGAGDWLVERGWVLLHNPSRGIAFPTKNPVKEYTKAQKEFLYDYYMERDCKKEANAIWQEDE